MTINTKRRIALNKVVVLLRIIVLLISLCVSSYLFGQVKKQDTSPRISHRLIIVYKEQADQTEIQKGKNLHKQYGGEFKEHLKIYPADLVQFPKTFKENKLKKVCLEYEKHSFINGCYLDREIRPDSSDCVGNECDESSIQSALDAWLQELKELIEKDKPCKIFPLHGQKEFWKNSHKYSPFWAQEYVGVDLVKEEMREIPWAKDVTVAVFDAGYAKEHINLSTTSTPEVSKTVDEHGTAVANIINGKGPYGASEKVDYVSLKTVPFAWSYFSRVNELIRKDKVPQIISNSMTWTLGASIPAKKIAKKGTIWVKSTGNEYPEKISKQVNTAPIILVGSMDPNGFQSSFSQESDSLTILAPSGNEIASIGNKGEHISFGGTSGATPLVSGSLVNALSLLPDLTLDEARTLLRKTATPHLNPSTNSAGILNSYRLFKVAERIALQCGYNKEGNQKEKSKCKQDAIKNDKTYSDFLDKDSKLSTTEELANAFPSCFDNWDTTSASYSCDKKIKLFNKLRKMAYLEPNNSMYWQQISCITQKSNLLGNADYYSNLALFAKKADQQTNKELLKQIALKSCYTTTDEIREFLTVFDQDDWTSLALEMLKAPKLSRCLNTASNIMNEYKVKSPEIKLVLTGMANDKDSSQARKAGLKMLANNYSDAPETKEFIKESLSDPDEKIRLNAPVMLATAYPDDTEIHQILIAELNNEEAKLSHNAAQALGSTLSSNPEIEKALFKVMKSSDDTILQFNAIQSLGQLKTTDTKIIKAIAQQVNEKPSDLQLPAIQALKRIHPKDPQIHLALAKALKTDDDNIKIAAINALASIAPTNSYVIHQLRRIRRDKNPIVRKAVARALKKIEESQAQRH